MNTEFVKEIQEKLVLVSQQTQLFRASFPSVG